MKAITKFGYLYNTVIEYSSIQFYKLIIYKRFLVVLPFGTI